MIRKFFYLLLLSSVFLLGSCTREQPVLNLHNQLVPQQLTINQVKKCIELAGVSKGWQMQDVKPGLIHGSIARNGHYAEINVSYSKHDYSIEYQSSQNLLAKHGYIHRNYNKWINSLNSVIKGNLVKEQNKS